MHSLKTIVALSFLVVASASAQSVVPVLTLGPNTRIRATVGAKPVVSRGKLISLNGDALMLARDKNTTPYRISVSELTALDTAAGRRHQGGKGLAIGLGIGAVGGAVLGAVHYDPHGNYLGKNSRGNEAVGVGIMFGIVGAIIGLLIGLGSPTDRWAPVTFR